jgi:hypothetical protein
MTSEQPIALAEASPALSSAQLARLAELGEERTATVGEVRRRLTVSAEYWLLRVGQR